MFRRPSSDSGTWIAAWVDRNGVPEMVRDHVPPYSPDHLVEWGSITKAVTATAVRTAIAKGVISEHDEVLRVVPRLTEARFSVLELLEHRSGLPRMARPVRTLFQRDPYAELVERRLDPKTVVPLLRQGDRLYSNLGYAVLGEVLDEAVGSWWAWAVEHVLRPAGVTTATLEPRPAARVLPRDRSGRTLDPWPVGAGPYAAAGGVWSTFDDLCRFLGSAACESATPPGWQSVPGADVINGATRHSRACAIRRSGATRVLVTHGLRLGTRLERKTVELARASCPRLSADD
ncbi:hypothetical protein C1N91_15150 [Curtobacterium sp. SGAir0471]|uniref:serine hydrolase domain-containing protein n=1 Tax=Curtobacterium sp. SGAir0471 TaxID=2070337 RepID=UPI0010CCF512|nr:serine hydrolase domain-containing protein [Curtobacterium sp. SGAir0471]QCR44667.1 hypothetical protein C1N91_15150 [Curtobacterium sp. SGAir0471]